jgi:hypothetical protein
MSLPILAISAARVARHLALPPDEAKVYSQSTSICDEAMRKIWLTFRNLHGQAEGL